MPEKKIQVSGIYSNWWVKFMWCKTLLQAGGKKTIATGHSSVTWIEKVQTPTSPQRISDVSWMQFNLAYGWWMVLPLSRVHHQHDSKLEEIIQEGCRILSAQDNPKYTKVACQLSEHHSIPIPAQTLCNCFLGKTKNPRDAHQNEQLLSPDQEKVLVDWIQYLSSTGHPLSKRTIRKKAYDIRGKKPSRNWIPLFLCRHPEIKLGKPSGLDLKQAQAFNHQVVWHHFDLLKKVIKDNGIP